MKLHACELAAKAKINLSLDIKGRRDNGYHDLDMIMQTVELSDIVRVETADELSVSTNLYYLPSDKRNIACKVAERFFEATGIRGGCRIQITKSIPVSAGLAGGSTDGAAVLKGLNRLYETGLSTEELCKIALPVGSDIPFCLQGGTMRVGGIGEELERLPDLPYCRIVICKPGFGVSTEQAYKHFDSLSSVTHPDTEELIEALKNQDIRRVAENMRNVLEESIPSGRNEIRHIEDVMIKNGALGAMMSGSGPSVFGIFELKEDARKCADILRRRYRECFEVPCALAQS